MGDGLVTGGTAIGGAPYLHALDVATGAVAWQQPVAAPTYGAPAIGNGVRVIGGTDFTLRALDLANGAVLFSDEVSGAVSGGPAIIGDDVLAVAGIREPSFVWGPANQIYFPSRLKPGPITTGISAIRLDKDTVLRILNKEKQYMDPYYAVTAYPNPRHITIITRPTPRSCVQVIDGTQPEYSRHEDPMILLVDPYSETEKILTEEAPADVPETLFGAEPAHNWCYLYEKAALARQHGDWQEVLKLADEAAGKKLKPYDLIEWMPFLQAYALNGKTDELAGNLDQIQSDEYKQIG